MAEPAWDVVVVGGGAAGCVLAARLSENPHRRVLLLEAGPDVRTSMPADVRDARRPTMGHDWGLAEVPGRDGAIRSLPRGKLLGGCSSTNATFALRGHPADYDEWEQAGNTGWSFADVLPDFVRLESDADFGDRPWHGNDGPLPIRRYADDELTDVAVAGIQSLEMAGFPSIPDANEPGAVGVGLLPSNHRQGVRVSTALAYLPTLGERDNLVVRCNAEATGVLMDHGRATGVRTAATDDVAAGAVVLAAGTYLSPALLLRSGIGPPYDLADLGITVAAALPGVGANLTDHPAVSVDLQYAAEPGDVPVFQAVGSFLSENPPTAAPDLQCLVGGPYSDHTFFLGAALLKPASRGSVRLASPDPAAMPLIDLGFFTDPADVGRLVEGLRRVRDATRSGPVAALSGGELAPGAIPDDDAAVVAWVRASAWTYHHPVGTCAMGPRPDSGAVVDHRGRVHGVAGLWVADASVMPSIPSANTHVPTVMVAEHLAPLIDAEL